MSTKIMIDKHCDAGRDEPVHGGGAYIDTQHGRIYVEVEGEGPPVLLVPGGPGVSHVHYHPWFSRLAERHTVVYYDHPGTGRSARLSDKRKYSLPVYVDAIEAIRRWLKTEAIALVGLSFGGLPAIAYACRHPERVGRLVMSNAAYSAQSWQEGNIDNVNHEVRVRYPELWESLLRLREQGVSSLADEYQDILGRVLPELEWYDRDGHPALTRPEDAADASTPLAYEGFIGADPEWTVGGSLEHFAPDLSNLRAPVLVIAGRHDRVTPVCIGHRLCQELPEGTGRLLIFERSSHRPWAEEPDRYFAALCRFLE